VSLSNMMYLFYIYICKDKNFQLKSCIFAKN